ncbi:uncharacterized protein [Diadema setosum]|uniref:uncharacterized protein n=1 Tax=Diadema setosum TaxID=31175 RepID=UPI003B3A66D3
MTDVLQSRPDVWEGTASILTRSANFLARLALRRPGWQLQIFFLKVIFNTDLCLQLYKRNEVGRRPEKTFKIRNYTTRFGLPEYARRLTRERGRVVTIQTSDPLFEVVYIVFEKSLLSVRTAEICEETRQVPDIPYDEYTCVAYGTYELPLDDTQPTPLTSDAPPLTKRSTIGHTTMGGAIDATSTQTTERNSLLKSRSTSDVSYVNNLPPERQSVISVNEDGMDNRRASYAVVKELRSDETLTDYVMQFRRDQHKEDGIEQTLRAADINQKSLKLACHKQSLVVAGVSTSLAKKLHVGDVLLRADNKALYTTHDCYDTFKCAVKDEVALQLLRVPQGIMCHVNLPEDGLIEALGAEFESDSFGIEVTKFNGSGLLVLNGQISNRLSGKFSKDEEKVNLGLVEINQNPVPLDCSNEEVQNMLRNAGRELTLVFLPMDLVEVLHVAAGSEK